MGLDDDLYSTVRSQILAMDLLPSLDRMFNRVQQEETHKRMMNRREARLVQAAFATMVQPRNVQQQERSSCKHCGKLGHEELNCFELIIYPANWGTRGGGGGCGRG